MKAQPEPGGRIKSVEFGGGFVELGAQWLHGTKNELCQIAKENDFLHSSNSSEGLGNYYCTAGKVVQSSIVNDVASVVTKALSNLENLSPEDDIPESVGEYLTKEFQIYINSTNDNKEIISMKQELFDWHLRFQVIDNACTDLWTLSAKYFGNYKFCGGDDYVNFKCGYSSVVDHLVSKLPAEILFTKCPVKNVRWKQDILQSSKNTCEIETEIGDIFLSEHVIITCSVGFLKDNWSMFEPTLPKQYLKLEKEPILWTCDLTGFDPVVGLPQVLLGWVGGDGAIMMERFPSDVIGKHCTLLLREIIGDNKIPEPKRCIRSSWYSNKYIKGGYSHLSTNNKYESVITSLLKPVCSNISNFKQHASILFAGEALHKTCYSTTHGAFESGKQQATNLINLMNSNI